MPPSRSRQLVYGTKVRNPAHRGHPFAACSACGKLYTHLGVARHWPKCAAMRAKRASLLFALGRPHVQLELPL
jgi:hypothetical protein